MRTNAKRDRWLRAPTSVGRNTSTRVDQARKWRLFLAIDMNTCTVVGRGEEGPLCDLGFELLLAGSATVV